MMSRWMLITTVLVSTGCAVATDDRSSWEGAATCEPGEAFECICSAGVPGVQTCDEAGTAVSPCECGGPTGSPPVTAAGGSPPVTGTGGSPGSSIDDPQQLEPIDDPQELEPIDDSQEPDPGEITPDELNPGTGTCCPSGNCLCHGPDPSKLTSSAGPFATTTFNVSTGTVHYPTNAEPPFAAVAVCGGFTNTGPEMASWGSFYASHGIVTIITTTGGFDFPDVRAQKLLASIEQLKGEQTRAGSPLNGKLAGRYGTSGYSMGGGGTTIASRTDPTLLTSVGLASWNPTGTDVQVPTLLLCGTSDGTAPCSMSQSAYGQIPSGTPKMMVAISGVGHLSWFNPTSAGSGTSGETALAFQKVFLEGDERWRPYLLQSRGTVTTTIQ
jgi:hypothetical protein